MKDKQDAGYPPELTLLNFPQIPSTNNYLKNNLEKIIRDSPLLVIAAEQTQGRGRGKRLWFSPPKLGLYASFGLVLTNRKQLHILSLSAGVAVCATLAELTGLTFHLKWPNDIVFKGCKVAGILIENTIREESIVSICGIGINLNHSSFDFPPPLSSRSSSLRIITGNKFKPESASAALARHFLGWIEAYENGHHDSIVSQSRKLVQPFLNRGIEFHQPDKIIRGIMRGLSADGGLILEVAGEKQIYYSGELQSG